MILVCPVKHSVLGIQTTLVISLAHDFRMPNHQLQNIKNDYSRDQRCLPFEFCHVNLIYAEIQIYIKNERKRFRKSWGKKKKKKAQPKSPKDWVLNFDPIANILQNLGRIT